MIIKWMSRLLGSIILIYLINIFIIQYKIVIPINLYSISFVSILGVFGLVGLIFIRLLL